MFLLLPLSLLVFGTPAVVGVPLNHTRRAAQAASVILNGETYVNKVSVPPSRCQSTKSLSSLRASSHSGSSRPTRWNRLVCGHVIVTLPGRSHTNLGDTIGGIGSAIALSSFSSGPSGTYTGQLIVQPDRGFNMCAPPSSRSCTPHMN